GEQAMGDGGVYASGAPFLHHPGGLDQGPGRDGEVVDDQHVLSFDGADQLGGRRALGVVAADLVDYRPRRPQRCGPRPAPLGAPGCVAHARAFLAKPASGDTTTRSSSHSRSATARHRTGMARRSSTGTLKNPCSCGAWRSRATTRSAPAASMASAHTRARIDTL